jgi:hypothetical protein
MSGDPQLPSFLLPSFLAVVPQTQPPEEPLPAFLLPALVETQPPTVTPAEHRKALKDLHLTQFDIAFPTVLDKLSSGQTLTRIMKEYHADLDAGMFVRWVKRDPERAKLYDEAMAYRTDLWADRMVEYSEGGNDGLEDVQRSKLKVDTLKFLIAADNRKKYGSAVQVDGDVQTTITINAPWMSKDRLSYVDQVQDVTPRLPSGESE